MINNCLNSSIFLLALCKHLILNSDKVSSHLLADYIVTAISLDQFLGFPFLITTKG